MDNNMDLIDLDDLEITEVDVRTLRDTVALPETAASCGDSVTSQGSCSHSN
ncbi:thiazolylpeptide-type bacteriocin [Rugosimonospora africana]|uniref:thiazolylpeptide-type bacteriocin n=1 Tax=Rugosimonospora africana TaxID=556532 RepID=UPI001944D63A|nr:thiazolylpeptide-type bacteriocin [Rugosimonospora africana]